MTLATAPSWPDASGQARRQQEAPMNGQTSEALLSLFDSSRLRPRYWVNFSLLSLITVLEFFASRSGHFCSRYSDRNGT
jgi:hypothetical protein